MDFGFKNPPKSALGRLLGRLVAVLGRLGVVLRRLGSVLTRLGTSWRRSRKLQSANQWIFNGFKRFWRYRIGVGPRTCTHALWSGVSVRTPKLPFTTYHTPLPLTIYHLPFTIYHTPLPLPLAVCCLTPTHAVARSAVADLRILFWWSRLIAFDLLIDPC